MGYGELFSKPFVITLIVAVLLVVPLQFVMSRQGPRRLFRGTALWIIVSSWGLLLAAIYLASREPTPVTPAPQQGGVVDRPISDSSYSTCFVFSFPAAESLLDPQSEPVSDKLEALPTEPAGCLSDLTGLLAKTQPRQLIVVGRTDRRELSPRAARIHDSNVSLAFDRARTVIAWLNQAAKAPANTSKTSATQQYQLAPLAVPLSSGPRYAGDPADVRLLARDRSVEIRTYWNPPPLGTALVPPVSRWNKIGRALNTESLEPSVSLAVLSLFVALSAYLATVGFFMRERAVGLKKEVQPLESAIDQQIQAMPATSTDVQKLATRQSLEKQTPALLDLRERRDQTEASLQMLMVVDLPMIVAALFVALHVFYFFPPAWLRTSIVLVTFPGLCLVWLHGVQWVKTIVKQ